MVVLASCPPKRTTRQGVCYAKHLDAWFQTKCCQSALALALGVVVVVVVVVVVNVVVVGWLVLTNLALQVIVQLGVRGLHGLRGLRGLQGLGSGKLVV